MNKSNNKINLYKNAIIKFITLNKLKINNFNKKNLENLNDIEIIIGILFLTEMNRYCKKNNIIIHGYYISFGLINLFIEIINKIFFKKEISCFVIINLIKNISQNIEYLNSRIDNNNKIKKKINLNYHNFILELTKYLEIIVANNDTMSNINNNMISKKNNDTISNKINDTISNKNNDMSSNKNNDMSSNKNNDTSSNKNNDTTSNKNNDTTSNKNNDTTSNKNNDTTSNKNNDTTSNKNNEIIINNDTIYNKNNDSVSNKNNKIIIKINNEIIPNINKNIIFLKKNIKSNKEILSIFFYILLMIAKYIGTGEFDEPNLIKLGQYYSNIFIIYLKIILNNNDENNDTKFCSYESKNIYYFEKYKNYKTILINSIINLNINSDTIDEILNYIEETINNCINIL